MGISAWARTGMVAGGALILAGCGLAPSAASTNPVLASVNGQPITTADWLQAMDGLSALQGQQMPTTGAAKKAQVEQLAVWAAVEQWVLKHHLINRATAASRARALVTQYEASAGGPKTFAHDLAAYHLTIGQFTHFMTSQEILEVAFLKVTKSIPAPSAAAIQSYYNANKSLFMEPASDQLRIIVVKSKTLAQSLEARLQAGASFAALAKQYSLDKLSAAHGGEIGVISQSPTSGAPSTLLSAMAPLKAGQYGIAPIGSSYYLFQVEKVNPAAAAPLSQVRTQIATQLKASQDNTAFQAFGQAIERQAHVVIHVK
jgi:hypothetical protein